MVNLLPTKVGRDLKTLNGLFGNFSLILKKLPNFDNLNHVVRYLRVGAYLRPPFENF